MRVLIVDDDPGLRQSLGLLLNDAGYQVAAEGNAPRALERALEEGFDLLLCDVRMPDLDGMGFLKAYRARGGSGLVVMMSAYGGEAAALDAMKEGAYDYIPKPFRPDEVILTLRKAEERERLRREVAQLRAQLGAAGGAARDVVAESPAMRRVLALAEKVAAHNTTVLLTGESGVGKEVLARAICRLSPRADGPFVAVNCAAIPEHLLESELFGHVRGAFTGANQDRPGLFEAAHEGTLLLDEIGELPSNLQAKLLRVLQESEIRRVGDQKMRRVDVRLLAATAKDLAAEVEAGRFREDLFYRLNVVAIHIPALRDRPEDLPALVAHFALRTAARVGRPVGISPEAVAYLAAQPWPGNVRELGNAIERAAVLSHREVLTPDDFRGPAAGSGVRASGEKGEAATTLREAVDAAEREAILAALRASGGNRRGAARRLGVSLRTLFYKLERHGIA
ncbi:MAG: sigma-54-dependent transcriptional regulator [Gemmatimonadales bacterium]